MENELAFFDREVRARHSAAVLAGVDEAGRGPLAGPVCCAAVILPADITLEGVNDSKKLTAGKREQLFSVITGAALSYSVVSLTTSIFLLPPCAVWCRRSQGFHCFPNMC